MKLFSEGFDIEVEIAAYCSNANSVKEVPISYNKRIGIQKLNSLRDGFKIISSILDLGRRFNPMVFYSLLIAALLTIPGGALLTLSSISTLNNILFPVTVWGSLLITVGVQFLILSIILSQIKHLIRNNNLSQIEKDKEFNKY
jgi:dolichol-phosphate mannosyltransferase